MIGQYTPTAGIRNETALGKEGTHLETVRAPALFFACLGLPISEVRKLAQRARRYRRSGTAGAFRNELDFVTGIRFAKAALDAIRRGKLGYAIITAQTLRHSHVLEIKVDYYCRSNRIAESETSRWLLRGGAPIDATPSPALPAAMFCPIRRAVRFIVDFY